MNRRRILKVFFAIIFALCILPKSVFAEEKELVIDFTKIYDDGSNVTSTQEEAWAYLMIRGDINLVADDQISQYIEKENSFISDIEDASLMGYASGAGKLLITFDYQKNYLSVFHNVDSKDNFRVEIDQDEIMDLELWSLEEYDSIYVIFGPLIPTEEAGNLLVDFTKIENVSDMSELQINSIEFIAWEGHLTIDYDESEELTIIKNKNGKILLTINNEGEIELGKDVTEEDTIVYEFTEDELAGIRDYIRFPYEKITLIFVPKKEVKNPDLLTNPSTGNKAILTLTTLLVISGIGLALSKREKTR